MPVPLSRIRISTLLPRLFVVALSPVAAPAQSIDFSLNVFYASPTNLNSGGTWELVAKSSGFGIALRVAVGIE